MQKTIAVLPGDGIGPEVTAEAVKVLKSVAQRYHHSFRFEYGRIGAAAMDETGSPFPEKTKNLCESADAILLGAIGDPKYDQDPAAAVRPEQGLLALRKALGLYANIRPVSCYDALAGKIPLKPELVKGVDLVVIRELTGGIYFGEKGRDKANSMAYDVCTYSSIEISRVAHLAYREAQKRKRKLVLVDKANVLETSRLWRKTVTDIAQEYPDVSTEFMYVDNAAMQLILNPRQFDVILTENMFGDILTDEASVLAGSLGLMPSASLGDRHALFEPIHGSYPQAAGKNTANPAGAILSAAMMLELHFGLGIESAMVVRAVEETIGKGHLTADLATGNGCSTSEFGDKVADFVLHELYEHV